MIRVLCSPRDGSGARKQQGHASVLSQPFSIRAGRGRVRHGQQYLENRPSWQCPASAGHRLGARGCVGPARQGARPALLIAHASTSPTGWHPGWKRCARRLDGMERWLGSSATFSLSIARTSSSSRRMAADAVAQYLHCASGPHENIIRRCACGTRSKMNAVLARVIRPLQPSLPADHDLRRRQE